MLILLLTPAFSSPCLGWVDRPLPGILNAGEEAYLAFDAEGFDHQVGQLRTALPCLDTPLSPSEAARVHLLLAAHERTHRDDRAARPHELAVAGIWTRTRDEPDGDAVLAAMEVWTDADVTTGVGREVLRTPVWRAWRGLAGDVRVDGLDGALHLEGAASLVQWSSSSGWHTMLKSPSVDDTTDATLPTTTFTPRTPLATAPWWATGGTLVAGGAAMVGSAWGLSRRQTGDEAALRATDAAGWATVGTGASVLVTAVILEQLRRRPRRAEDPLLGLTF